jgi:hypothetical protein
VIAGWFRREQAAEHSFQATFLVPCQEAHAISTRDSLGGGGSTAAPSACSLDHVEAQKVGVSPEPSTESRKAECVDIATARLQARATRTAEISLASAYEDPRVSRL